VTLPHEWLEQARADIDEAVSGSHELSDALRPQYTKRLNTLERQENYFLDLAAEEGWPKDKLRAKIYAIRTERKDIDNTLSQSEQRIN
jgi:site-specific DNA recombinase